MTSLISLRIRITNTGSTRMVRLNVPNGSSLKASAGCVQFCRNVNHHVAALENDFKLHE